MNDDIHFEINNISLLSQKESFNTNNFYLLYTNIEESKKLLNNYETYIIKYFESINTFYKELTEFNFNFLPEDRFKSSIIHSPIFQLGKAIKKAVQAQINNIYPLIANQKIFLGFIESLSSLSKILHESSTKLGKNSSNKNFAISHIRPIVLSLIESFAEIESKVINEYIMKKYNKHVFGLTEEPLKDLIFKAYFLEKTFLVFEEDSKTKLFNEFQNMEKRTAEIMKDMKKIVKNIVDILEEKNNVYLDELKNEIDLIGEIPLSTNSKDINIINNNLNENKNEQDIILKNNENLDFFKYTIRVIHNPIIQIINNIDNIDKMKVNNTNNIETKDNNDKKGDNLNDYYIVENYIQGEENIKENDNNNNYKLGNQKKTSNEKELTLTEEDIFNIVSTLYNYDFKLLNKSVYDLNIEKQKVEVAKLTDKLLTFDGENNINEIITDEEVNNLYELLNNRETFLKFFIKLNNYRGTGRFEATNRALNIIINIFNKTQDYLLTNRDIKLEGLIIILSQTFYIMKDGKKFFIQKAIKDHPLFQKEDFWENYMKDIMDEEIKKIQKNSKTELSKEKLDTKINHIIFSKVVPIYNYMSDFKVKQDKILNVINNIFNRYQIKEEEKNKILSLLENND